MKKLEILGIVIGIAAIGISLTVFAEDAPFVIALGLIIPAVCFTASRIIEKLLPHKMAVDPKIETRMLELEKNQAALSSALGLRKLAGRQH